MNHIGFNKPYLSGKETTYILEAVRSCHLSGNGTFTKKCQHFFEENYGFRKSLLTTSCTDALEMCALLLDIQEGDEIIMPAYTFVSTANAFMLRNGRIRFCDSYPDNPNINADRIEELVTNRTKAIVAVHYAGVACQMDKIMEVARRHGIFVIEDAAQAIDSYYNGEALGGIGDLGTFSFHETKNIMSGEGGLLSINNEEFISRAEIIWEKGTNRSAFFRGELDKYGWVDLGSSFLPNELTAAFLFAQLENLEKIQARRIEIWKRYFAGLSELSREGRFDLATIPDYATVNGHLFYLLCRSPQERSALIDHLRKDQIHAVFHYQSLHRSQFFRPFHDGRELPNCDKFAEQLVRLPLYYELTNGQVDRVVNSVHDFYGSL